MGETAERMLHKITGWQVGDLCKLDPSTFHYGNKAPGSLFQSVFKITHIYDAGEFLPTNQRIAVLLPVTGPHTGKEHDILEDLIFVPRSSVVGLIED